MGASPTQRQQPRKMNLISHGINMALGDVGATEGKYVCSNILPPIMRIQENENGIIR